MKGKATPPACLVAVLVSITASAVQAQVTPAVLEPGSNHDKFAVAASLRQPAVSEVNGKVDYAGGNMNSAEGHNFNASITLPVTRQFGFQADALYSRISGLDFSGGAGHFFWRDPGIGLLGIAGSYLHRNGVDSVETFQAGAEGQLYYKQFTFGFFGGLGSISYRYPAPFIDTNPTRFVGRVSADFYPIENLRVGASFTSAFRDNLGQGELEYQTPINGLALTGEIATGDHGYDHWLLGVRYYFGSKKTLRARHRQDDPPALMPGILHNLGVYGAEYNRKANAYLAAHPSSANSGGAAYGVTIVTTSYGSSAQQVVQAATAAGAAQTQAAPIGRDPLLFPPPPVGIVVPPPSPPPVVIVAPPPSPTHVSPPP